MATQTLPPAQRNMLAAVLLAIPLSAWGALYPENTWLQIGPVVLLLLVAPMTLKRWSLSDRACACLTAFLLLHLLAARWSYSSVPYNDWLTGIGFNLDQAMGFQRNMFDRLVHGMFGALFMLPLVELYRAGVSFSLRRAALFGVMFIAAASALYEIFEWSLTILISPEDAGTYNGEQGDMFDSQKDMACAIIGAIAALPFLLRNENKRMEP